MVALLSTWRRVSHGEEGQDLSEYTLLLSLVTLALVLAIYALRAPIMALFTSAANVLAAATGT